MEITQYTYFQQVGSIDCQLESAELTYGLERIAMYIQEINNVVDIEWVSGIKYGDVFRTAEFEHSKYSFEEADTGLLFTLFDQYEREAKRLLDKGIILPAYDYVLKCSHTFNILDARKAISVTERTGFIGRVRNLARLVAQGYLKQERKWDILCLIKLYSEVKKMSKDLLFEIGTEEIPANYMPATLKQVRDISEAMLKNSRIAYEDIKTYGTPRRIVLLSEVLQNSRRIWRSLSRPFRKGSLR